MFPGRGRSPVQAVGMKKRPERRRRRSCAMMAARPAPTAGRDGSACGRESGGMAEQANTVAPDAVLEARRPFDVDAAVRTHAPFLHRALERLCGGGAHVDDLLQDVFVVAFQRRADLAGLDATEVRRFLYGVARHKAQHRRRFVARLTRLTAALFRQPAPLAPDAAVAQERLEVGRQVRAAALALPFLEREVFVLHHLEGLSANAIGALLDLPEGTVWSRLHSARRRFRTTFAATQDQP